MTSRMPGLPLTREQILNFQDATIRCQGMVPGGPKEFAALCDQALRAIELEAEIVRLTAGARTYLSVIDDRAAYTFPPQEKTMPRTTSTRQSPKCFDFLEVERREPSKYDAAGRRTISPAIAEFAAGESERLLEVNAELVAALARTLNWLTSYPGEGTMGKNGPYEQARAALAKVAA